MRTGTSLNPSWALAAVRLPALGLWFLPWPREVLSPRPVQLGVQPEMMDLLSGALFSG